MNISRLSLLIALLCNLCMHPLAAQNNESLDNATIIDLQKMGLGDAVIVEKIKSSRGKFDVSINGLKQLKTAGVSDEVIRTMIATTSTGQVSGGQAAAGDVNDPSSTHEAGIWLCETNGGKVSMKKLEPSVYSQGKTGSPFLMGYGVTQKSEAKIQSAHATPQTDNRRPVFYFYFEKAQSGLSETRDSITSPNEFILANFKVEEKDGARKLVVGKFNAYSGSETGPEDKAVRAVDVEKITPGIYKVMPKQDLANGEYGFFYGGQVSYGPFMMASANGGKIFDFGVKGSPETEPKNSTAKTKKNVK